MRIILTSGWVHGRLLGLSSRLVFGGHHVLEERVKGRLDVNYRCMLRCHTLYQTYGWLTANQLYK